MPIYEFKCTKSRCQRITIDFNSITDNKIKGICRFCGAETKRIMSIPSGFDVKGYSAKNGYSKEE